MNNLKGFISIPSLANNTQGVTAPFGELSTYASTFSRYKSNYSKPANYAGVELIAFTTKTDTGVYYTPSQTVSDHILQVAYWVYQQHITGSIPSNTYLTQFKNDIALANPDMTNVDINEILVGSSPTLRMPDYVAWEYTSAGTLHHIKIWFSDSRFRSQFDDFEILVVPPLPVINDLNASTAVVAALLAQMSYATMQTRINTAVNQIPPTAVVPYDMIWHDPGAPGATMHTAWMAVVYGQSGNDADNIKAAISAYIAANSVLNNWDDIYPDLYAENEYVVIPLWGKVAVPPQGLDVEMYDAGVNVGTLTTIATNHLPGSYALSVDLPAFLSANLTVAGAFFRSLTFLIVGNPNNVDGDFNFTTKYPDYAAVTTSSPDFLRMSANTRGFVTALNGALTEALTLTEVSAVPVGYQRVIRSGKVYLGFSYGGFSYLVLAKVSYNEGCVC